MKHESIVVVYDSCQAIAEDIADKLGAETISVQSLDPRHIGNSQSFVLLPEFQADSQLTSHWQYASQTFRSVSLSGKTFAIWVAFGKVQEDELAVEGFCEGLRKCGAHIIGNQLYKDAPSCHIDDWVCLISPNL
jgi:hypothetical protein